jgi:FkbH-like protein
VSTNFFQKYIIAALFNLMIAGALLGPMLLAAAGVALLLLLAGAGPQWPWVAWVIMTPVVYLSWVILFLAIAALITRQITSRHPTPQYWEMRPGRGRIAASAWRSATFYLVEHLPLARSTGWIPCLSKLPLRAYSPTLNLGTLVLNYGVITDPDLTEVGDNTIIGYESVLVAHAQVTREDGVGVFSSAPIKIGHRVTIGGGSWVCLGCTIGDDAVLEPRAVVAPFTKIPPGEVWGGNPASFLRKRKDVELAELEPAAISPIRVSDEAANISPAMWSSTPSVSSAALRELVIDALQLAPDRVPVELSKAACAEWDSLGQVAIAAALFDRYGVAIDGEELFRICTLNDIADLVTKKDREPADRPDAPKPGESDQKRFPPPEIGTDRSSTLSDDVDLLPLLEPQGATRALAARFNGAPAGAQHLRVCIAASFTVQPLASTVRVWGRAFGLEIECSFADYDQIEQALLDPDGEFAANHDGVNVILTRIEDFVPDSAEGPTDRIDDLLNALRSVAANGASRGQILVGTLPPVVSPYNEVSAQLAGTLRSRWGSALDPVVQLFDFGGVVEHLGVERARSSGNEAAARAPYSLELYQRLGIGLVRSVLATRRAPAKVIALDCDNTLWGGIVGEVGLDGIQLGADGPGRSFQLFQRYLKRLQARGFLLVVASRNEPHDVREVFEKHPEMVLRPDDIAAWRVNWEPKSQNLRELADELRLGLDSFVFLDDDPVARLEIKSLVPEVHVVPLPSDPSSFCETLAHLWLFDGPPPTAVDSSRTRMMHEESQRQKASTSFHSLDEFLAGLELEVEIGPPDEQEWARVAQLTQRTNQFNLSLRRYTLEELRNLTAEHSVMALKARDRFGEYGLVGTCVLLQPDRSEVCELDTLLMSCRALGRGVEDAFLHGVGAAAARQGASKLVARYVQGPRNAQIKPFLARHGFTEVQSEVFSLPLDEVAPVPAHVRFIEHGISPPRSGIVSTAPADASDMVSS